ncbi:MAG TPA: polyprenol monophosphomannose synthase [Victivallales bacterium]|nr:polyprenol monophosphomannose synthase [Victivallales bacterium]HRR06471.1 polyprenol monophosphomannose synthase [Victivallales bacterium]HRR29126.1 polyprenol monophosphomannose synthase [Victivallales bacterium]HRU01661.1 polyprenol monophosphomannose synthase [Victivallales bacterium]
MKKEFSIIIPTYNEAENIVPLLKDITKILGSQSQNYEIIVSDDNSPDLTWQIVENFAIESKSPNIKIFRRLGKEKGLSRSVVDAFNVASGDILIVMDGDRQHEETCLLELIKIADNFDMVIGSRFTKGAKIAAKWPFYRKIASKIAIFATNFILGTTISDPMSGFFSIKNEKYQRLSPYIKAEGFKIMLEILYFLKKNDKNAKITEIPIKFRNREKGESKLGILVILDLFKMILRLKFHR